MKTKLFTLLVALTIAAGAAAQTDIVTMKTAAESIKINVAWTGEGNITANSVLLTNDKGTESAAITPVDGVVTLIATGDAQLTDLFCGNCGLISLDVTKCTALTNLSCGGNPLTALDVTKCTALTTLNCASSFLTALDVTECTALEFLSCTFNAYLASLDVSNCVELKYLHCGSDSLTSLDVSKCVALNQLRCRRNSLTELNLLGCSALTLLNADNQQIEIKASLDATTFANPIRYKNKVATEQAGIGGIQYAKDDEVAIPAGDKATFITASSIGGLAFSGTITINRVVSVAFDLQNGSAPSVSEMGVNTVALIPFNPTRPSYTFNGWFTAPEGGDKIAFPYTVTKDITFYAQWAPVISVSEAEADVLTVYSIPGGIAVGELITVYSSSGVQVAVVAAQNNTTFISLTSPGLYIVKAGGKTAKIIKE